MSAQDHLSPQQFMYHGTRQPVGPGDEIAPDHPSATSTGTSGWVYATPHVTLAYNVAKNKPDAGPPRVVQVEATGALRHDPEMSRGESYRSRSPLKVVRELSRDDIHSAMMDRWGRVVE